MKNNMLKAKGLACMHVGPTKKPSQIDILTLNMFGLNLKNYMLKAKGLECRHTIGFVIF